MNAFMQEGVSRTQSASAPVPPSLSARIEAVRQSPSPLLGAARPLLDALASTPVALDGPAVMQRHRWLEQELRLFSRVCSELKLNREHAENARYCLCSALDEAALQTAWGRTQTAGMDWSIQGLAATLGYDRQGGDRVYRIIDEALSDPYGNAGLLRICLGILERGFQGRYRYEADGRKRLQMIYNGVENAIRASYAGAWPDRGFRPVFLPSWRTGPGMLPLRRRLRLWWWLCASSMVAVLACVAGYYDLCQYQAYQIRQMSPVEQLVRRLNDHLGGQIGAGTVSLSENATHTALTLRMGDMFASGQADINTQIAPLVAIAGQQAATLPVSVTVTGYTDDAPLGNPVNHLNQTLSGERAIAVMRILLASGMRAERMTVTGRGYADPLASNGTASGRTKNRRVELTFSALPG